MAEKIVGGWLETGMLKGRDDADKFKAKILKEFGSHSLSLDHGRHFGYDKVHGTGVSVERLEADPALQDALLSVHHAFTVTMMQSATTSIVENHLGVAFINQVPVQAPPQMLPAQMLPAQFQGIPIQVQRRPGTKPAQPQVAPPATEPVPPTTPSA